MSGTGGDGDSGMPHGPRITWIASYPKSGNTWVRFLLYSYFYGEPQNSRQLEARIPDLHALPGNCISPRAQGSYLCKTHFLWDNRHPNREHTLQSVYVLRHPRDVLLSNLNYFRLLSDRPVDAAQFARNFIESGGAPYWRRHNIGSLLDNATGWTRDFEHPRTLVRYEDLHAAPDTELAKVLRFLGVQPDAARVKAAVEASTFERMRAMEEKERQQQEPGFVFQIHPGAQQRDNALRFMNRGNTGQTLASIDPHLDDMLEARFDDFLRRFGY